MTKPKINLSINPSYFCNFRCHWCYLTPDQLGDKKCIDHFKLSELLNEVQTHRDIEHIDLYGGEIGVLKEDNLEKITNAIKIYYKDKININTNLSMVRSEFMNPEYFISVSYDMDTREKHEQVFENMKTLPVEFSVLMLATPEVMKKSPQDILTKMNHLSIDNKNFKGFEIKPYSTNQANQLGATHADFEDFILKMILEYKNTQSKETFKNNPFPFINELNIKDSLNSNYNAYSDDHLYITPNGKFAVLDFDKDDNEYFLELDSFADYEVWCQKEKEQNISDICRKCEYLGRCLTEHYRYVKTLKDGCNGYRYLLDTYSFKYGK